ncbi:unnamed protein product [Clonostachys rosea f. rosea IK726]|uniref:Uncharacterized protein n=1 Tax=Clonostachys rosea f. rosea IK726 TaxID=1349383 RepID=A0ACA9UKD4_BIOOC|nr:unnamed protein product [Clonostachys rosea f. rosea IK726]
MPVVKIPCLQCKGDDQQPKCGRCESKGLTCERPSKKTVFHHDSSANFSKDQKWVSSQAKLFQFDAHTPAPGPATASAAASSPASGSGVSGAGRPESRGADELSLRDRMSQDRSPLFTTSGSADLGSTCASASPLSTTTSAATPAKRRKIDKPQELLTPQEDTQEYDHPHEPHPAWNETLPPIADAFAPSPTSNMLSGPDLPPLWPAHPVKPWSAARSGSISLPPLVQGQSEEYRRFPLEDPQEACLMSYYIYELAHWLDLADPERHFEVVVPFRARTQPHLLNAIFALAARHLSRMPQFKTPQGVVYFGQPLPKLDRHSSVEYMLRCIPALRHFHDAQDDEYRDSIIATCVLLRQLEEIDDEEEGASEDGPQPFAVQPMQKQINFLPIIDAVLRSPPSQTLFGRRSLIRASYWMALRQEIFHSFTRRQAPQMILAADYWSGASSANKAVMHTVQVVKWRWGDGSAQEWSRLIRQQEHLEQDVLVDFLPIFRRPADKSKGEIFPTVWYGSTIEVTTIQQALMAKSVLAAEDPSLKSASASRAAWRKMESDVRALILELCGISLCHPSSPPAILNATCIIQLYGDFFTDPYERQALKRVAEKYRDVNAWPSRKLMDMFV